MVPFFSLDSFLVWKCLEYFIRNKERKDYFLFFCLANLAHILSFPFEHDAYGLEQIRVV